MVGAVDDTGAKHCKLPGYRCPYGASQSLSRCGQRHCHQPRGISYSVSPGDQKIRANPSIPLGVCEKKGDHRMGGVPRMILKRNDSWIVGAASRSYYGDLLAAGVRIFEYEGGLLHTKSLTLDGEVTLIGSANMGTAEASSSITTTTSCSTTGP